MVYWLSAFCFLLCAHNAFMVKIYHCDWYKTTIETAVGSATFVYA